MLTTPHYLQPIAQNALTILINISSDKEVLKLLADDDAFLETMLLRMTVCQSAFLFALLCSQHSLSSALTQCDIAEP